MKRIMKLVTLSLIIFASSSAQGKEIKGNQEVKKETHQLAQFEKISISSENVSGDMNVNVSYAIQPSLEIEGESNLLEYVITEVKGSSLVVKVPKSTNLVNNIPITLNIALPIMKSLEYAGSGKINAAAIMSDKMEYVVSGRGDLNLKNLSVSSLKLKVSGNFELNCAEIIAENAEFNLSGTVYGNCNNLWAPKFKFANSSTGTLTFDRLKSVSLMELTSSGSGRMEFIGFIGKSLKVTLSGTSDINITGTTKDLTIISSGAVNFNAFSLVTKKCKVVNSGTSAIYVAPTDNLDVTLSGTGNLYYKGSPKIKVENSGNGQLINKN